MPITGILQPEIIEIDPYLRLRHYTDDCPFALDWYQEEETLLLVDAVNRPYDLERLYRMYHYLQDRGEVYFIEVKPYDGAGYMPIGDVSLLLNDLPIVIGDKSFRGKGIGTRVVEALIARARELGLPYLEVAEIYGYNTGSQKLFHHCGFQVVGDTKKGHRYRLMLPRQK